MEWAVWLVGLRLAVCASFVKIVGTPLHGEKLSGLLSCSGAVGVLEEHVGFDSGTLAALLVILQGHRSLSRARVVGEDSTEGSLPSPDCSKLEVGNSNPFLLSFVRLCSHQCFEVVEVFRRTAGSLTLEGCQGV
jgi:hypothetical protein